MLAVIINMGQILFQALFITHSFYPHHQPHGIGTILILAFTKMRKLRGRVVNLFAQGHVASSSTARIPLQLVLLHTSCSRLHTSYTRLPVI